MGCLDADQLGQAVEKGNVPGCQGAAGDQVVEGPAYVDHHLAARRFLVAIFGQLRHQNLHHVRGCKGRKKCGFFLQTNLNKSGRDVATYPCGLCWRSAWLDFSAGRSAAAAPRRCPCLKDPGGWAASSPAPAPPRSEPMPTWDKDQRSPHYDFDKLKNEFQDAGGEGG